MGVVGCIWQHDYVITGNEPIPVWRKIWTGFSHMSGEATNVGKRNSSQITNGTLPIFHSWLSSCDEIIIPHERRSISVQLCRYSKNIILSFHQMSSIDPSLPTYLKMQYDLRRYVCEYCSLYYFKYKGMNHLRPNTNIMLLKHFGKKD